MEEDLLQHRPREASFDLVAVLYLQVPPDERRLVLARAAAAVSAGGTLLVVGHDLANLTEGHGGPKDPAILLTPGVVAAELPGLVIERAERVRRPVTVDEGMAEAVDTLVRARRPGLPGG